MVLLRQNPNNVEPELTETGRFSEDLDSTCSTPYDSAPSSPGCGTHTAGYFFSAPASPMRYVLSSIPSSATCHPSESSFLSTQSPSDFEFQFSSRFSSKDSVAVGSMSSADELFLNGQIRPMKLSSHLQRPQILAPLIDIDGEEADVVDKENGEETVKRGRDLKLRSRSLHRKARSLSPLRNGEFEWHEEDIINTGSEVSEKILELQDYVESKESGNVSSETTPSCSASSSRSSSSGRNSKKWIFLKDLLYRSKSEGRGNGKEKFWSSISFAPSKEKEKKLASPSLTLSKEDNETQEKQPKQKLKQKRNEQISVKKTITGKPANSIPKRRVPPSAHELHYTANRAQAEEMKKRTYLPYRQGLFGCLGFSSKGYGALNGLAKTLNPVSFQVEMPEAEGSRV